MVICHSYPGYLAFLPLGPDLSCPCVLLGRDDDLCEELNVVLVCFYSSLEQKSFTAYVYDANGLRLSQCGALPWELFPFLNM